MMLFRDTLQPVLFPILYFNVLSVWAQFTVEFTLPENCPLNTLVGSLYNQPPLGSALPLYATTKNAFQLLTPTNLFYLNETSGDLLTRNQIDRETICSDSGPSINTLNGLPLQQHRGDQRSSDNAADTVCRFRLQALYFTHSQSNSDVHQHHVIIITIIVLDINDNPPGWQESTITFSVTEHTPVGTRFLLPSAYDPDCGPVNTTISYTTRSIPINGKRVNDIDVTDHQEAFQLDTELVSGLNNPDFGHSLWSGHSAGCFRRDFKLWLRVIRDLEYDESPALYDGLKENEQMRTNSLRSRHMQFYLLGADGGQPVALTGSVLISITVTDTNDHAPVFRLQRKLEESQPQHITIPVPPGEEIIQVEENMAVGRVVYTAQAVDIDDSDKGKLKFYMETSAGSLTRTIFEVRAKTGEIVLLQTLDYEKIKYMIVPIGVTDGKHRVSLRVHIFVINQNDHPPTITIQPVVPPGSPQKGTQGRLQRPFSTHLPHGKAMVTLYVREHEPPGRFIATVTVSDTDEVPGSGSVLPGQNSYASSVHMTPNRKFEEKDVYGSRMPCQINLKGLSLQPLFDGAINQFKLLTTITFDREQQTEQYAVLTCVDRGQPPLSSQMSLHLVIEDINDHIPVFKQNKMIAYLKENEPPGSKVYVVEATDSDIGVNAQLTFSLDVDHGNDFAIDPTTGVLTSLRSFNREHEEQFNLTVRVSDRGNIHTSNQSSRYAVFGTELDEEEQHMLTGKVHVYIQDVNDCPPVFTNPLYQLSVPEDAKSNLLLGQINANDSDATEANNQIHYKLRPQTGSSDVQEFRVSPQGYIYVSRGNLDREKVSSYSFFLVAIDSGIPPLSSSTQVHVYLMDVNDNAPTWLFPTHNNQIINVTVSEPVGYRLAQLKAVDPDDGEYGEVQYRLVQSSKITITDASFHNNPIPVSAGLLANALDDARTVNPGFMRQNIKDLFELDPISGSLYIGRSMGLDDVGTAKLVVEASDQGRPPKVNHRILQVNVLRYLTHTSASSLDHFGELEPVGSGGEKSIHRGHTNGQSGQVENDLIVIVIMVAITLIISLVLIMAILFLRCGVCPLRGFPHYSSALQNDCRRTLNRTHHLEEVFRDSGNIDDLHTGNCNQFSDTCLGAFHRATESEQMCQSFLSTSGTDPWVVTTLSPKINSHRGLETINFNRTGGSVSRFNSPVAVYDFTKRPSIPGLTTKSKLFYERPIEPQSVTSSPNHEVKLVLSKRPVPASDAVACSTFRASCSHLSTTPSRLIRKCDDTDSLDSGQGRSSATENGAASFPDTSNGDEKWNARLSTFGGLTSRKSHCDNQSSRQPNSDVELRAFGRQGTLLTRPKCGTLPLSFGDENRDDVLGAKSITDVSKDKHKCANSEVRSVKLASSKMRQSVTWLDSNHETYERKAQLGCFMEEKTPPECHADGKFKIKEDTLVLYSPTDPLGYTQLARSPSISNCDRMSPTLSVYSSFPTSFV
ncbi:unnamed protein product [Dicrocoelium dendriticum]|nr:unnamed protein product [Dicrocoelium dendriticum]